MMWNSKLVSVILLCYNSADTVPRALESIFMQDYPNLEIIITDDGSPDFVPADIENYLRDHQTPNVKRVKIVTSPTNTGTVRNLRRGLAEIHGDYYINFGSDDVLDAPDVISTYIRTFCLRGWEPLLVTGQLAMYTADLGKKTKNLISRWGKKTLYAEDAKRLYNELSHTCIIPTVSTCYRRDFHEVVNAFDPAYKYYEDYPTFLRMARMGVTPVFVDKVMVRHAAGGIANGNKTGNTAVQEQFYRDRLRMWRKELDPYKHLLTPENLQRNEERRRYEYDVFLKQVIYPHTHGLKLVYYKLTDPTINKPLMNRIEKGCDRVAQRWHKVYELTLLIFLALALLWATSPFPAWLQSPLTEVLYIFGLIFGGLTLGMFLLSLGMKLWKCCRRMKTPKTA